MCLYIKLLGSMIIKWYMSLQSTKIEYYLLELSIVIGKYDIGKHRIWKYHNFVVVECDFITHVDHLPNVIVFAKK